MSVLDIHGQAAQHLFNVTYRELTDEQIERAKRINYGLAYKTPTRTLAEQFNVSEARIISWKHLAPHRLRSKKSTRSCWKCGRRFHRMRTLMRHESRHGRRFSSDWWRQKGRELHEQGEQLARDFIKRITTP